MFEKLKYLLIILSVILFPVIIVASPQEDLQNDIMNVIEDMSTTCKGWECFLSQNPEVAEWLEAARTKGLHFSMDLAYDMDKDNFWQINGNYNPEPDGFLLSADYSRPIDGYNRIEYHKEGENLKVTRMVDGDLFTEDYTVPARDRLSGQKTADVISRFLDECDVTTEETTYLLWKKRKDKDTPVDKADENIPCRVYHVSVSREDLFHVLEVVFDKAVEIQEFYNLKKFGDSADTIMNEIIQHEKATIKSETTTIDFCFMGETEKQWFECNLIYDSEAEVICRVGNPYPFFSYDEDDSIDGGCRFSFYSHVEGEAEGLWYFFTLDLSRGLDRQGFPFSELYYMDQNHDRTYRETYNFESNCYTFADWYYRWFFDLKHPVIEGDMLKFDISLSYLVPEATQSGSLILQLPEIIVE